MNRQNLFSRRAAVFTIFCLSFAAPLKISAQNGQATRERRTEQTKDAAATSAKPNSMTVAPVAPSPTATSAPPAGTTSKPSLDSLQLQKFSTLPPAGFEPRAKATARLESFNRLMLAAINARLGTPYRFGSTGPYSFDCSGFVWSVFQEAGIKFERASARTLWEEFAPATVPETKQFGTLVFFNNLHHVGIVADANGFYHASSSHGVAYAPFAGYWEQRIVGFRRAPIEKILAAAESVEKQSLAKN